MGEESHSCVDKLILKLVNNNVEFLWESVFCDGCTMKLWNENSTLQPEDAYRILIKHKRVCIQVINNDPNARTGNNNYPTCVCKAIFRTNFQLKLHKRNCKVIQDESNRSLLEIMKSSNFTRCPLCPWPNRQFLKQNIGHHVLFTHKATLDLVQADTPAVEVYSCEDQGCKAGQPNILGKR